MNRLLFAALCCSVISACSAPAAPIGEDSGTPAPCNGRCSADEQCIREQCLSPDCIGALCADSEVCLQNVCVPRECVGVACAAGEICAAGQCYPTQCGGRVCGTYEICKDDACIQARCVGRSCNSGEQCFNGECYPPTCSGTAPCTSNELCAGGACAEKACIGIVCPAGEACVGGSCGAAVCADGNCTTPPAPSCADAVMLRTYASRGSCVSNACSYTFIDTVCAAGCSGGACLLPDGGVADGGSTSDGGAPDAGPNKLTFVQTWPKLRSRINAIDSANSSGGPVALAVGPNGYVARWNGADWTVLTKVTSAELESVWMANANTAYIVGDGGTLLRYYPDGGLTALPAPNPRSEFVSVHGSSAFNVLTVDRDGGWVRYDGLNVTAGQLPPSVFGAPLVASVYASPAGPQRAVGECGGYPCAYYSPSAVQGWQQAQVALSSKGNYLSVGPSNAAGQDVAAIGTPSSGVVTMNGNSVSNNGAESAINNVTAISPRTGGGTWLLTSPQAGAPGRLYQVAGTTSTALDLLWGSPSLSRNDNGGLLVADSRANSATVLRRAATGVSLLDLGEDWTDAQTLGQGGLLLFSRNGHVASRSSAGANTTLTPPPLQRTLRAGAGSTGSYVLTAGDGVYLWRASTNAWTTVSPSQSFNAACYVSDTEIHLVGNNGALAVFDGNGLTTLTSVSTANLNDVHCLRAGSAIAVGANGVILRLANGVWSAFAPAPPVIANLDHVWVAPDGTVYVARANGMLRATASGWTTLPSLLGVTALTGTTDGTPWASAGANIYRFTGTAWQLVFTASRPLNGASAQGDKLTFVGLAGVVVESQ